MDCCNYVQPYPGHGQFYQQHYFCYDNMNGGGYTGYGSAPISDAIEANARYARLQSAYPTDYVYNPKEARLRKAMREQSRELSRQSILSVPISAGNSPTTSNVAATSGPATNSYKQMQCQSPGLTTGPTQPSQYTNNRIVNPWFSLDHNSSGNHMKPVLSHRIMQPHRTFENTKEILRNSSINCTNAFPSPSSSSQNHCGYSGDFSLHATSSTQASNSAGGVDTTSGSGGGGLESNDYCGIGEFTDGQKWHPYQNGPTPYHPRMGAMTKIPGRHSMATNPHGHNPWSQFCGLPLSSIAAQNAVIHGPRHMVFLQDQQERRCAFPDDIQYMNNKMDIGHHHVQPNYSQTNYQENDKRNLDSLKWENESNENTSGEKIDDESAKEQEKKSLQKQLKKEEAIVDGNNDGQQTKLLSSKQPLPGFHQAFGSTEIGRFSRSEYFANMLGDNGVSINNCTNTLSNTNNNNTNNDNNINELLSNGPIDTADNFNNGLLLNNHIEREIHSPPRWHSPYVNAIGGDI